MPTTPVQRDGRVRHCPNVHALKCKHAPDCTALFPHGDHTVNRCLPCQLRYTLLQRQWL